MGDASTVIPKLSINEIGGLTEDDLQDDRPCDMQVTPCPSGSRRSAGRKNLVSKICAVCRPHGLTDIALKKVAILFQAPPAQSPATLSQSTVATEQSLKLRVNQPLSGAPSTSVSPLTPDSAASRSSSRTSSLQHKLSSSTLAISPSSDSCSLLSPAAATGIKDLDETPSRQQGKRSDGKAKLLTAHTARKDLLPAFTQVQRRWTKIFLPTLYDVFYRSREPFRDFMVSTPQLVGTIQTVVDCIYPDFDHTVQLYGDAILLVVCPIVSFHHPITHPNTKLPGIQPVE